METKTFRIEEALRVGWSTMRRNLRPCAALVAFTLLLGAIDSNLRANAQGGGAWLAGVAVQLAQMLVGMMWIRLALDLRDGATPEWTEPFARVQALLPRFLDYLVASVLYALIVLGGLLLLVVPGVLWAVRYGFVGFVVLDEKRDPIAALRRSARLTRGHRGHLLLFGLAVLATNLVGLLAFGVGLFATLPTTAVAAAWVYRRLVAAEAAAAERATPPTTYAPRPA